MKRSTFALLLLAIACERGELTLPAQGPVAQLTVDASTAPVYVDLGTGGTIAPASAATSAAWDIGFSPTGVTLNGSAGGVVGYCICQNAAASDAELLAFSADNQLTAFESVTTGTLPASASWSSDVFAVHPWFRSVAASSNHAAPTFDIYLVRHGANTYKVQLTSYYGPAGEQRRISVRYGRVS